jgi:hypothetical protein
VSIRCSVCAHPDIDEINAALVAGAKQTDLVTRYELRSKFAVSRHFTNHIPAALALAREAEVVASSDDLLAKVQELEARAQRVAHSAEASGERRTVLLAVRELARIVELLAKLRGELDSGTHVNVILAPEWLQVREAVLVALTPYPEARAAVAGSLLELEAGDP